MTKVTVHDEPKQTVKRGQPRETREVTGLDGARTVTENAQPQSKGLYSTTDALDRRITYAKPTALQNMRLFGVVDEKLSRSQGYMLYARLASSVRSVGSPGEEEHALYPPLTTPQLEAAVQLLDEEGIAAVMAGWIENGWISVGDNDVQEDKARDAVKN